MAHGYLGDGYGIHGESDERGDERERNRREREQRETGWRDREREERGWSSGSQEWRGGDRGMFGGGEHNRSDESRWSGGSSQMERHGRDEGFRGSADRSREQTFSAHPDDHYRSWRDTHMSELDRDYQDYCREREQQFHQEFSEWRRQKYGNPQPLRTGMTQTGISHDPSGETQAIEDAPPSTLPGSDPTATATLGTNSGEGGRSGR